MKSVEFDETQAEKLDKIAWQLFEDESDPRSISYKRVLVRPKINWVGLIAWVAAPAAGGCLLFYFFYIENIGIRYRTGVTVILFCLYFALTSRWFVVCMIQMYQRFAPGKLRRKCRFEPSCSEYMIRAVRKYGVVNGVWRGWRRLGRCNITGGGYDEP